MPGLEELCFGSTRVHNFYSMYSNFAEKTLFLLKWSIFRDMCISTTMKQPDDCPLESLFTLSILEF